MFQVYFDLYEQELERFEHSTKHFTVTTSPELKITATSEQELDAAVDTIKMHM